VGARFVGGEVDQRYIGLVPAAEISGIMLSAAARRASLR
jgi:hypothetical protein